MKNHVRTLGGLYLLFGLFGLVVAWIKWQALAGHMPVVGKISILSSTSGFTGVISFMFVIIALPALVAGFALLKPRAWARILALVTGFLCLVIIPLGTALGIYAIWVLTNEEARRVLDSDSVKEAELPRVFPPYH
ncbi:MAG: hypothetical protein ONB48_19140 [candidate division KSB1 bacterium]|nr:hypothetical protein [candidate division KSB1 bacterium]MDZ7287763.1 hypothetical protein [candidate division KSB1 bacterium]MDZ7299897.1 hypothetical protein [candidate division KSB1 bacterium]MDZ7309292.1 hypothetical protein [candidate division KSB1 bacterium]MDZ7350896.1 hypothetical protein [candidate division KSB1 bacterium]